MLPREMWFLSLNMSFSKRVLIDFPFDMLKLLSMPCHLRYLRRCFGNRRKIKDCKYNQSLTTQTLEVRDISIKGEFCNIVMRLFGKVPSFGKGHSIWGKKHGLGTLDIVDDDAQCHVALDRRLPLCSIGIRHPMAASNLGNQAPGSSKETKRPGMAMSPNPRICQGCHSAGMLESASTLRRLEALADQTHVPAWGTWE